MLHSPPSSSPPQKRWNQLFLYSWKKSSFRIKAKHHILTWKHNSPEFLCSVCRPQKQSQFDAWSAFYNISLELLLSEKLLWIFLSINVFCFQLWPFWQLFSFSTVLTLAVTTQEHQNYTAPSKLPLWDTGKPLKCEAVTHFADGLSFRGSHTMSLSLSKASQA